MVYDKDFDVPLARAKVTLAETGQAVTATEEGNYVFPEVAPGTYTLVVTKDGYTRRVKGEVQVAPGRMTEVDAWLAGEFTEMEEFVVKEVELGGGTEEVILELRTESPAMIDGISADLISQTGASDAGDALRYVAGATVQDGKYAVVRGLPDRYVNSQMNSVRLPTADADKRAVQLDQFPSAIIENVLVTKSFTPNQQGDASGGAVNVLLKGIPNEPVVSLKLGQGWNTQAYNASGFLSYPGGGVGTWGLDDRGIPMDLNRVGAVGVHPGHDPYEYDWSVAMGGKHAFDTGVRVGGFASFYTKRDAKFYDDGIDDAWILEGGETYMTPRPIGQGTLAGGDIKTQFFDVTQSTEELKWGGLATLGIETDNHTLSVVYMRTHTAEDSVTLAEDTRGKEYVFGTDYDPNDVNDPGNQPTTVDFAPYIRYETLKYTERDTWTLQFSGTHTLTLPGLDELGDADGMALLPPQLDWTVARSSASMDQPDKRQFGSLWQPASQTVFPPPPFPPIIVIDNPATHMRLVPSALFSLGNVQRLWKQITEVSDQVFVNLKLPFRQWTESEGYLQLGIFRDETTRHYEQASYFNSGDQRTFEGPWELYWSNVWTPSDAKPFLDGDVDVNYRGYQKIWAWYYMMDLPLTSWLNVIGGIRYEDTSLSIENFPEDGAEYFPDNAITGVNLKQNLDEANTRFDQGDVLPSIGLVLQPLESLKFRCAYSETVARQTFKELSPILQMEYLGGPVFVGNPGLKMPSLQNYDVRVDYTPYPGGLFSVSAFRKDIQDPIEYIQRRATFSFTYPINYPRGKIRGYEMEARQDLGQVWEPLKGLAVGANATFIDSEVLLTEDEIETFDALDRPLARRPMVNTPERLYNLYATYNIAKTGTQFGVFYTVKGDTLVAGAGTFKRTAFIPSVYALEHGSLNVSVSQKLGKHLKLSFKAKNLTDPTIREVYRSEHLVDDVLKSQHTKGIDYSIGISAEFTF